MSRTEPASTRASIQRDLGFRPTVDPNLYCNKVEQSFPFWGYILKLRESTQQLHGFWFLELRLGTAPLCNSGIIFML